MVKKLISEFVGTMLLVIFGCGTAVALSQVYVQAGASASDTGLLTSMYGGIVLIALAFGLVLTALVYTIGKVSGCHVNPAISFACLIDGRMGIKEFVIYVVAQILGGIGGALILSWIFASTTALGANGYGDASVLGTITTPTIAFLIEAILTFIFALVVLSVTKREHPSNGIIIGLTLTLVHLFGIPFTGTSVNPARSIGPAILTKGVALSQLWVFILAPLVGAALAALFYKFVISSSEPDEMPEPPHRPEVMYEDKEEIVEKTARKPRTTKKSSKK